MKNLKFVAGCAIKRIKLISYLHILTHIFNCYEWHCQVNVWNSEKKHIPSKVDVGATIVRDRAEYGRRHRIFDSWSTNREYTTNSLSFVLSAVLIAYISGALDTYNVLNLMLVSVQIHWAYHIHIHTAEYRLCFHLSLSPSLSFDSFFNAAKFN